MATYLTNLPRRRMLYFLLAAAVLLPFVVTAIYVDDWGRDFSTNRAATDPEARAPLMRSLTQRFTVEELDEALTAICQENSAWSLPPAASPLPGDTPLPSGDQSLAVRHLVRTTRWLRFRDDVWISVTPAPGDSETEDKLRLNIESRSRIGVGDLGQNPRNLRELNSMLMERLILKAPPPSKGAG